MVDQVVEVETIHQVLEDQVILLQQLLLKVIQVEMQVRFLELEVVEQLQLVKQDLAQDQQVEQEEQELQTILQEQLQHTLVVVAVEDLMMDVVELVELVEVEQEVITDLLQQEQEQLTLEVVQVDQVIIRNQKFQEQQAVQVSWSLEQMQVKELHYQRLLAVQFLMLEIQQVV
jgi:hypothetical protein